MRSGFVFQIFRFRKQGHGSSYQVLYEFPYEKTQDTHNNMLYALRSIEAEEQWLWEKKHFSKQNHDKEGRNLCPQENEPMIRKVVA